MFSTSRQTSGSLPTFDTLTKNMPDNGFVILSHCLNYVKLLKELFLLSLIMFWLKMALIWKLCNGEINLIASKVEFYVNKKYV